MTRENKPPLNTFSKMLSTIRLNRRLMAANLRKTYFLRALTNIFESDGERIRIATSYDHIPVLNMKFWGSKMQKIREQTIYQTEQTRPPFSFSAAK